MDKRWRTDAVVAGAVAGVVLVAGLSQPAGAPVGVVLLVGSGLALVARRRAPIAVLAVTGLCALGYQAAGFDVPAVAFLFAVYFAVRAGRRLVALAASMVLLATLPLAALVQVPDTATAFAQARGALEIAWLIAAGAAGEALRQAERRADDAERTREETARRRADAERLHIARELHDSLTHQISVITVQSEAAVHIARKRGDDVPAALLAIRDASREAARELRATLEALRDEGAPRRGVAQLPELIDRARSGGVTATLEIAGQQHHDVPVAVDRTAFRIVQESLTNVVRHAAGAAAAVRIEYRPDRVIVQVDDDGAADSVAVGPPGVGLLGMRERVTALGGQLRAAPRAGGGFQVHAELPVVRPT